MSGESRLTVSLATPASRQSWPKLQSFIVERPVVAGVEHQAVACDRSDAQASVGAARFPGLPASATGQCCESTPSDGKHSSGVRRKSSWDARVRFMDCSLSNVNEEVIQNLEEYQFAPPVLGKPARQETAGLLNTGEEGFYPAQHFARSRFQQRCYAAWGGACRLSSACRKQDKSIRGDSFGGEDRSKITVGESKPV